MRSQRNLSGTTSIREAAAAVRETPSALQHDQDSQHAADADSAFHQHATAGGQEGSCSLGQQPTVPEVGTTQASRQASSGDLDATAVPSQAASVGVTQHTQHPTSHEQMRAPESLTATADAITSCIAADGEAAAPAAALAADHKGASGSVTVSADAARKQSCGQSAPPTLAAASTAGVSSRPGAVRKSGGDVEGRQSSLPAVTPAQTAADMLSWLDATLSAKKPLKAAGSVPDKVQRAAQTHNACMLCRTCMLSKTCSTCLLLYTVLLRMLTATSKTFIGDWSHRQVCGKHRTPLHLSHVRLVHAVAMVKFG